jgi:hypothetical protein
MLQADNNAGNDGLLEQSVENRTDVLDQSVENRTDATGYMLRTTLTYGRGPTHLMAAHVDWDNQEHGGTVAAGMDASLFEIVGFRVPISHYFFLQNEEHGDVFTIIRTYGVPSILCRRHSTGTIRNTLAQQRCPFPSFGLTWVSVTC